MGFVLLSWFVGFPGGQSGKASANEGATEGGSQEGPVPITCITKHPAFPYLVEERRTVPTAPGHFPRTISQRRKESRRSPGTAKSEIAPLASFQDGRLTGFRYRGDRIRA